MICGILKLVISLQRQTLNNDHGREMTIHCKCTKIYFLIKEAGTTSAITPHQRSPLCKSEPALGGQEAVPPGQTLALPHLPVYMVEHSMCHLCKIWQQSLKSIWKVPLTIYMATRLVKVDIYHQSQQDYICPE